MRAAAITYALAMTAALGCGAAEPPAPRAPGTPATPPSSTPAAGGIDGARNVRAPAPAPAAAPPASGTVEPGGGLGSLRGDAAVGPLVGGDPDGGVTVVGALDRDQIQAVMRGASHGARRCYEAALASDPNLAGRLRVSFTIEGDGSVSSAEVDQTDVPTSIGDCLVPVIRALRFPPPRGGARVVVRYPYVFRTAE